MVDGLVVDWDVVFSLRDFVFSSSGFVFLVERIEGSSVWLGFWGKWN